MRPFVENARFPARPGVYVVYEEGEEERALWVGASPRQTLHTRWRGEHLAPRSGASELRRMLAGYLGLTDEPLSGDRFDHDVEQGITHFLRTCQVELLPTDTGDEAERLARETTERLRPMLSVEAAPAALPNVAERDGRPIRDPAA